MSIFWIGNDTEQQQRRVRQVSTRHRGHQLAGDIGRQTFPDGLCGDLVSALGNANIRTIGGVADHKRRSVVWRISSRYRTGADQTEQARSAMKISKSEARYGRGTQQEHCGQSFADDRNYCRHFIAPSNPGSDTGTCTEVSGSIGRVYWCKLFSKARPR
jgi:hypothetical protein